MSDAMYIGLDVHQATISAVVLNSPGKLLRESIPETKATTILQFIPGLRGSWHVTLEEGTCAAWLHDVLKPHVIEVLVCDPRKNALLKSGNKNDRIDAGKLAELLGTGLLSGGWATHRRFLSERTLMVRQHHFHISILGDGFGFSGARSFVGFEGTGFGSSGTNFEQSV